MQPSNDLSGVQDTHSLLWQLANKKHVVLEVGNYYFTKVQAGIGIVPILQDGVTIDGVDWNHTTLHMVGEEPNSAADWYLFHPNNCKNFTLRNATIDGSLLNTASEQTHGLVAFYPINMTVENVRGRHIYGDTIKLIGSADNVVFRNTEHISNNRSGISMRSYADNRYNTDGGVTIDGFYAWDISDQAIDMEPGFQPGELLINNARIYARSGISGFCLALTGSDGQSGGRLIMTNSQIFGRVGMYNLSEVILGNCIVDSSEFEGRALEIRMQCQDVLVANSIVKGRASDGLLYMTVHNTGRPNRVSLSNLNLHVANSEPGGKGINAYDCQNVSINNVTISSDNRLLHGIDRRDVVGGIDRGYFSVNNLKVRNADIGVQVGHTNSTASMTDTLAVQNSHFRDVGTAVLVKNPEPNVGPYIRDWDFSGNVYGENVGNEVVMGSVFGNQVKTVTGRRQDKEG